VTLSADLPLSAIVSGVREQRWSATDVMRSHAHRIEARESDVQAWEHLDLASALQRAAEIDRTGADGALCGAPIAVKDIIDVAGMPTRYGSPIYADTGPAAASAACVVALERAGALVPGKAVTTEFAYYHPGKTRNPWNTRHTPGGSSMGSAAAVASGMAAGALGTQTNGSVIRPAAFCGIVGYKPSFGAVSTAGVLNPWPSLDHVGVFARNVADAALLASVIAREARVASRVTVPVSALRIAHVETSISPLAEPAQSALLSEAAALLARAGARVGRVRLPPELDAARDVHRILMSYEGARHFSEMQMRFRSRMSARMNTLLDDGRRISADAYAEAVQAAHALRAIHGRWAREYDVALSAPAPGEAPATLEQTGDPAFCTTWTLLGVPAITLPAGHGPAGLPLGVQLTGAYGEDDRLLGAAAWCEKHLD
jgi:Asp-tRNA(Asn)/Glu-tRNA(Gln) amidotransferase A subunit family amidase